MGKIMIIYEERCGDCHYFIREITREMENFFSDSGNGGTTVKRRIIIKRCKKCQPAFEQMIEELKKAGKVRIIPFGVSGRDMKDRLSSPNDFVGRDKSKRKKEVSHGDDHRLLSYV